MKITIKVLSDSMLRADVSGMFPLTRKFAVEGYFRTPSQPSIFENEKLLDATKNVAEGYFAREILNTYLDLTHQSGNLPIRVKMPPGLAVKGRLSSKSTLTDYKKTIQDLYGLVTEEVKMGVPVPNVIDPRFVLPEDLKYTYDSELDDPNNPEGM